MNTIFKVWIYFQGCYYQLVISQIKCITVANSNVDAFNCWGFINYCEAYVSMLGLVLMKFRNSCANSNVAEGSIESLF